MAAVQQARYAIRAEGGQTPAASNYAQELRARFEGNGASVSLRRPPTDGAAPLSLRLESWGVAGSLRAAGTPARSATSERVDYQHGGITEWWKNSAAGLEHGFDVERRPAGKRSLPLVLQMHVGNGWTARPMGGGLLLEGARGERLLYDKLVAFDANGQPVAGRLEPAGTGFAIVLDDAEAVYPLIVDPIVTNLQARFEAFNEGGEAYATFGSSVSVSGDTAVIGAPTDDTGAGANAGSAYVFVRNGMSWTQQARLIASDGATDDAFGTSVAVSGDTVVVGAYRDVTDGVNIGSAHVYVRNGSSWTEEARLAPPAGVKNGYFGWSVALSGDTALIGAYRDTTAGNGAGSAYVFLRSGTVWTQQAQLLAPDAATGDEFGYSVALDGDTAVIGSHFDDEGGPGNDAGSAYVFVRGGTTWSQQARLVKTEPKELDLFGTSVDVSGDTVVVGAYRDDTPAARNGGSAYVFVRSGTTWTQQAELLAADAAVNDEFGWSVALSGDTAVIGAYADDRPAGLGVGSAYVFVRTGTSWTQQTQLLLDDGAFQDQFGFAVAVDGDTILTGVNFDDTIAGEDAGSVPVFVRSGAAWTQQARLISSNTASQDWLGQAVAISGNTALVGAPGDDSAAGTEGGRRTCSCARGRAGRGRRSFWPRTERPRTPSDTRSPCRATRRWWARTPTTSSSVRTKAACMSSCAAVRAGRNRPSSLPPMPPSGTCSAGRWRWTATRSWQEPSSMTRRPATTPAVRTSSCAAGPSGRNRRNCWRRTVRPAATSAVAWP